MYFWQSYSFIMRKKNKNGKKSPLQADKNSQGAYFVKSRHIEQGELHAPPFKQSGQCLTFIATEREIFGQDVSVTPFKFPYQSAFGTVSATEQRARAYIVGEYGQEQGILAEAAEKGVSAEQVGTQERVRLPFGHTCRKPLSFQQAMTVTDIRIPTAPMPALEVFHAAHGTFEA